MPMAREPWVVSDELWELVEPLLPERERRFRYPGRKRLPDRQCLCGILFVLHTGIPWQDLPPEMGFGSGVTCWRRLEEWHQAGVWDRLHRLLLRKLRAADAIDFSRAIVDSSQVQAKMGAPRRARARSTAAGPAPSTTSSSTRRASRSRSV
jgi:transposase